MPLPNVALLLALLVRTSRGFRHVSTEELDVLLIGDQGSGSDDQRAVAESMAEIAASITPAAVIGIGDNIYPAGAGDAEKIVALWSKVYMNYSSLRRPWYMVAGNHDWYNFAGAAPQRDFTWDATNNEGLHWQMPHFWYKQSFKTSNFAVDTFHIDTQIWLGGITIVKTLRRKSGQLQSEQIQWLQDELSASTADWKIVVGHHPVYSAGNHGMNSKLHRQLDPILRQHGVPIYIAAHDHSQQLIQYRNLHYIVSGAGGKPARSGRQGYPANSLKHFLRHPGFAHLRFHDSSSATLTFYNGTGDVDGQELLENRKPDLNIEAGSCLPDAVRRRRQEASEMCSCRRRSSRDLERTDLEDGFVCDGYEIGRLLHDIHQDVPAAPKIPSCGKTILEDADIYCSSETGNGCTVSAMVMPNSNCTDYCALNGLACKGGWTQEEENCVKAAEIGCGGQTNSVNNMICECKPTLMGKFTKRLFDLREQLKESRFVSDLRDQR